MVSSPPHTLLHTEQALDDARNRLPLLRSHRDICPSGVQFEAGLRHAVVANRTDTMLAILQTAGAAVTVEAVVAHTIDDLIELRRFLQHLARLCALAAVTVDRAVLRTHLGSDLTVDDVERTLIRRKFRRRRPRPESAETPRAPAERPTP